MTSSPGSPLLDVRGLCVEFPRRDGQGKLQVIRDLSFRLESGEIVGLVGESGSGKSTAALALLGLIPPPGTQCSGEIRFAGQAIEELNERELRRIRGAGIGFVFQEPMTALHPTLTLGSQLVEAIRAHSPIAPRAARRRAAELLDLMGIASLDRRLRDYPHQLSGGQRQRALLALALAAGPRLLIADEPTSALDTVIQAQILALLARLRRELGLAILFITHDLAIVAELCDRALVMYAGELVESISVPALRERAEHPYSRGLIAAVPVLGRPPARGHVPSLPGQVPEAGELPPGCAFHPRCPERRAGCDTTAPPWVTTRPGEGARCVLAPRAGGQAS